VELSVVVSITGILATLATYSVRERVYEAHSVEAVAMLGNIRTGLLAKSESLTGNSGNTLQIGGRVGGFGGPLGLPGVLGAPGNGNGNDGDSGSGSNSDNGGGNSDDIDGDGDRGHGNNDTRCDPDNPGAKGGAGCQGGGDDSGDDGGSNSSGSSGGGDDSNGNGNGNGNGNPGGDGSNDGNGDSGGGSTEVEAENTLCGSAEPVPNSLESVKGSVYQSRPSDWRGDSGDSGWSCLSVSMSFAQRFQYGYDVGASAVPAGAAPSGADSTFAAWARGDLDGDGRTSWFVLNGASIDGQVVMAPALTIIDSGV
jgi:hypothetical protein